jgi:hypothetical protein
VDALVLLKLKEEGVESAQVVGGRIGVQVENGRQTEAKEEVVCGAASLITGARRGEAREVRLGEEERVEPVDAAFVSGRCQ